MWHDVRVCHEFAHAVVGANNKKKSSRNYLSYGVYGILNEAYADVLACCYDRNWTMGEKAAPDGDLPVRDIGNPSQKNVPLNWVQMTIFMYIMPVTDFITTAGCFVIWMWTIPAVMDRRPLHSGMILQAHTNIMCIIILAKIALRGAGLWSGYILAERHIRHIPSMCHMARGAIGLSLLIIVPPGGYKRFMRLLRVFYNVVQKGLKI